MVVMGGRHGGRAGGEEGGGAGESLTGVVRGACESACEDTACGNTMLQRSQVKKSADALIFYRFTKIAGESLEGQARV